MTAKKTSLLVAGALALVAASGAANAIPYTWSDPYVVPSAKQYVGDGDSVKFTMDITDGANGYRPGVDSLSSLLFSFDVYDNKEGLFTYESGNIVIDAVNDAGYRTASFSSTLFGGLDGVDSQTINTSLTLWDTGKYDITVSSFYGDFVVKGATLTARGDRAATSVPEPGSLALMGIGLLGAGLAARRRRV
jgi:hypothetical protein